MSRVEELGLSVRATNGLLNAGCRTASDVVKAGWRRLSRTKNFGSASLLEVDKKLSGMGMSLLPDYKRCELMYRSKPSGGIRVELASAISYRIRELGLTQSRAAILLGIRQPEVSELTRGLVQRFSIARLLCLAMELGSDVVIRVGPPDTKRKGAMSVEKMEVEDVD